MTFGHFSRVRAKEIELLPNVTPRRKMTKRQGTMLIKLSSEPLTVKDRFVYKSMETTGASQAVTIWLPGS